MVTTITLNLWLAILLQRATGVPPAVRPDTAAVVVPQWSVVEAEERGSAIEALLLVPASKRNAAGRRVVELQSTASLRVWFRLPSKGCASVDTGLQRVFVPADQDTLIAVCGSSARTQTVRLVAILYDSAARVGTLAAASDPVTVRPFSLQSWLIEPPNWLVTGLTGIIGFLGGLWLSRRERIAARDDKITEEERAVERQREQHVRAMESLVASSLAPEIGMNKRLIEQWLEKSSARATTPEPVTLAVVGGDVLIDKSRGVVAYLGAKERENYFGKMVKLYEVIKEYNEVAGLYSTSAKDRSNAAPLLDGLWADLRMAAVRVNEAFTASEDRVAVLLREVRYLRQQSEGRIGA